MSSSLNRRIERTEAATATNADEARWYQVASPEIAERMWLEAKAGRPGGVFMVYPGQAEPVVVGPTIKELFDSIAKNGRHFPPDKGPKLEPWKEGDPYLWRAPRPGEFRTAH